MKLVNLQEARYSAPPAKQMFFVVEQGDGFTLVGPFATSDDAYAYSKYIEGEYGSDIPINHEVTAIQSPEEYEKNVKEHRDWLFDED
jgi:hypothetical protein